LARRPAVDDDIVTRLEKAATSAETWAWDDGDPILLRDAAEHIKTLRVALMFAVGELLTHEHWGEFDRHEVVAHFLEEARRG
jgi:hypothetical protein